MIISKSTNQLIITLAFLIRISNAFHQNHLLKYNNVVTSPTPSPSALSLSSYNKNNNDLYENNDIVVDMNNRYSIDQKSNPGRRNFIFSAFLSSCPLLFVSDKALAFPNKISDKYDDKPKRKGSKPKGLGISTRVGLSGDEYQGLKECGAAPNCFCSTDSIEDDPEHSIPSWKWPKSISNKSQAFQELKAVIDAYKPGQSKIDGGGFEVKTYDPEKGYIYAQFESLKNGFIDDLELVYITEDASSGSSDNNSVQVRSSSRIGYLDFGVNAKRINYIAQLLREKGWDAVGVDFSTHQEYAIQNQVI